MKNILYLIAIGLTLTAFTKPGFDNSCFKKSYLQGYVNEVRGNQMPSPDESRPGKIPVNTTVYVHALTNIKDTRYREPGKYLNIATPLITTVTTDSAGYFKIQLPPGKYSLFVKVDGLLYATLQDGDGNIFPVEIKKRKTTKTEFTIKHKAYF